MRFLIGAIFGVIICLGAEYLFLTRGGMPVTTRGGPMPFERFIAKAALRSAVGPDARRRAPIPADEANLSAGARLYREQCAFCHGELGRATSAAAKGMFPPPPQLLPPRKGVTDDPVGETYWKVRNGIRLTGMPGYGDALSDTEIWQVSLFLQKADAMPAGARQALTQ